MEFKNCLLRRCIASQLRQSDGQLYERTTMLTYFRSLQRTLTLACTTRLHGVNPKEPPRGKVDIWKEDDFRDVLNSLNGTLRK